MTRQTKLILAAAVVLVACTCSQAAEPAVAKVYLPATVIVQADAMTLGTICVISCADEALSQKLSGVAMGRAPGSKEKITVTRQTILSRLATSEIAAGQVQLSGAEAVVVAKDEKTISAQDILRAAETYLQETRPGPQGCVWKLSKQVPEMNVPAARDIRIKTSLSKESTAQAVVLDVSVVSGDKELAHTLVQYAVMFPMQRAVAVADLKAGTVLTQENVKVETVSSPTPSTENFKAPYGMVAAKNIVAGTVIAGAVVTSPKTEVLVKRNQSVTMRIQGAGFEVSAVGEALEDGHGGDVIKVRNADTKRIVTAKVAFDGTVEPVMGEPGK